MDIFSQQLERHEDLLKVKGYDEEGLNSPDKPGWFLKQLERQFGQAFRDAHIHNERYEFDIKACGFFNQDRDVVLFKFNYEYDPKHRELSIKSLAATMNGETATFSLQANKDLPLAAAVYKGFVKTDQKLELAKKIAEHTIEVKGRKLLKIAR